VAVVAIGALAGCSSSDSDRLRVTNGGTAPIVGLTVRFPEESVFFGDIAPGSTTGYRELDKGVYGYAAYSLEIDGALVTQPVIDWVGEEPLEGQAFTYVLEVNPLGEPFMIVSLVQVTRDE